MSKGSTNQTTQTNSSELPSYLSPYVDRFLPKAEAVSNQPYTPYQNPRLANFSADTNNSFDMVRNVAADPLTGLTQAQNTAAGIAGFQPGQINTQDWTQANVQGYMNPYINNVLDVQKQRSQQKYAEDAAGRNAQAIQAGAFGGNRRFVQDSLAQRDLNQQLQEQEATGLANAYQQAQGMFTTDQGRMLQSQIANEESRRLGSQLGLDAARAQVDMTKAGQDLRLGQAEALSGVGSKLQQREQAGLDLAYQDFMRQQNYPYEQLAKYQSLLSGGPAPTSSTTTTATAPPDFLSQLIGLGLAGAGVWDMVK
jgi:hypothetical protein